MPYDCIHIHHNHYKYVKICLQLLGDGDVGRGEHLLLFKTPSSSWSETKKIYERCELPTKRMMQSSAYQIVSDTVPPSRTKHTPGCAHGFQVTDMLT